MAIRNESAAASASAASASAALPAFYMYEHPALDHSWLRRCDRFEPLRLSVNDSNTAEVGVAQVRSEERRVQAQTAGLTALWSAVRSQVLRRHPSRTLDPSAASLFFVPVYEYSSYSIGDCDGTTHRTRMEAAEAALRSSAPYGRNGGADHFFATSAWSISGSSLSLCAPPRLLTRMQHAACSTQHACTTAGRPHARAPPLTDCSMSRRRGARGSRQFRACNRSRLPLVAAVRAVTSSSPCTVRAPPLSPPAPLRSRTRLTSPHRDCTGRPATQARCRAGPCCNLRARSTCAAPAAPSVAPSHRSVRAPPQCRAGHCQRRLRPPTEAHWFEIRALLALRQTRPQ